MEFIDYLIAIGLSVLILWFVYVFGHYHGMREAYRKMQRREVPPRQRPRHIHNILEAQILLERENLEEKNV
ncbi:MAG TPA: hypothetical protein PKY59_17005 [Pyrinomonadaceae bacterium]|nr:hypothetical protein [Pyrinomonadaceae bacterium]